VDGQSHRAQPCGAEALGSLPRRPETPCVPLPMARCHMYRYILRYRLGRLPPDAQEHKWWLRHDGPPFDQELEHHTSSDSLVVRGGGILRRSARGRNGPGVPKFDEGLWYRAPLAGLDRLNGQHGDLQSYWSRQITPHRDAVPLAAAKSALPGHRTPQGERPRKSCGPLHKTPVQCNGNRRVAGQIRVFLLRRQASQRP